MPSDPGDRTVLVRFVVGDVRGPEFTCRMGDMPRPGDAVELGTVSHTVVFVHHLPHEPLVEITVTPRGGRITRLLARAFRSRVHA